jgi:hypothetical protein
VHLLTVVSLADRFRAWSFLLLQELAIVLSMGW